MEELISVIVPVYNSELYLERCVDSIISQTYQKLEIILVDDGSTDSSGEICDAYGKEDIRVKVVHKENGGAATSRNRGLEIAGGQYIGFVDSDDYIAIDMYESMYKYLNEDTDIVTCGRSLVYPPKSSGLKRNIFCAIQATKYNRDQAICELLKGTVFAYGVCEKLYRKELFNNITFPNGKSSEDLPVTYSLFKKCRNIVNIGEAKYFVFQRSNSISRSEFTFRKMDNIFFRRDILLDIKKEYPQFKEIAEAGYINGVLTRLLEIRVCKNRLQYSALEKRLIKVLRRMSVRILFNRYLKIEDKKTIFDLLE